jgi:hypothetical protein
MRIVMENYKEEERYLRAKKRVEKIKGFYWHLASYLIVNIFISSSKIISDLSEGKSFIDAFFDFGTFAVWIFWGIGIFFHAFGVFGKDIIFAKEWEDKKIQQFLNEEKERESKWQ